MTGYAGVMETATAASPDLTLADRCDRCGAQAFVRATLPSKSELLFCNHHGREFEDNLVLTGASIYKKDVSQRVNDTDH